MSDSNRTQVARVRETTIGTTPASPSMTKVRVTGESLKYDIDTTRSEEIRSDRLTPDVVQVGARVNGGFSFELSFAAFDDEIESAMHNTRSKVAEIENSAADTEITQVTDSTDTFTVASGGTAFVDQHLARTTGFTNSANNGVFEVSSSTATTVVMAGTPSLTDEAAPPLGAKIKAVGFVGASGDIGADATGLTSSSLDFTTLGLSVGQWIKIGGTATGDKFATAALNDWARITAIAANALTLDNRPSGWTTDNGSSKTIKVWFGDTIKIGTTQIAHTYEKVLLSQSTPQYRAFSGCMVNTFNLNMETGQRVTGSAEMLGWAEAALTATPLDASPDEAAQNDILNAVSNVGRIAENGTAVGSPNHARRLNFSISNNLREQNAIGTLGLIGIGSGDADITGTIEMYFGDETMYNKFIAGTATNINSRVAKNNQAYVFTWPNVKFEDAEAVATGRNQDVLIPLQFRALRDSTTSTSFQVDRFEYFE